MSLGNGCDGPEFGFLDLSAQSETIEYDYEIIASSKLDKNIDVFAQLIQDEVTAYVRNKLICNVEMNTFNASLSYDYNIYSVDASPKDGINHDYEKCLSEESNPNCYPINGYITVNCDSCSMIVLQTVKEAMNMTDFTDITNGSKVIFLGQRFPPNKESQSGFDIFTNQLQSHASTLTTFASENITVMGGAFIAGLVLSFSLLIYRFRRKRRRQLQEDFCDDNDLQLEVDQDGRKNAGLVYYGEGRSTTHVSGIHNREVFLDEDDSLQRNYGAGYNRQHVRESKYANGNEEFEVELY